MAEYIEREAFMHFLVKQHCENCDKRKGMKNGKERFVYEIGDAPCRSCGVDDALDYIEYFPSSDVQPVKHGRWIQDEHTYSGSWTYNFVCSSCGEIGGTWLRNIRQDQMFPFCPFCGARMDC